MHREQSMAGKPVHNLFFTHNNSRKTKLGKTKNTFTTSSKKKLQLQMDL